MSPILKQEHSVTVNIFAFGYRFQQGLGAIGEPENFIEGTHYFLKLFNDVIFVVKVLKILFPSHIFIFCLNYNSKKLVILP